jgi:hypothetical protein
MMIERQEQKARIREIGRLLVERIRERLAEVRAELAADDDDDEDDDEESRRGG